MKLITTIFCILIQFESVLFGQNITIHGFIKDKETHESLPYASLGLKNFPIGTVCNDKGEFNFQIQQYAKNDTLFVSYIGYERCEISLTSIKSVLKVELQPKTLTLKEVVVSPLSPEAILKIAINRIKENYAFKPFQTTSYYKESQKENDNIIEEKEAIFKSYYPTVKQIQHELCLLRKPDSVKKIAFMRASEEKERMKAQKRGEKIEEEENESDNNGGMSFGGPETILKLDLIRQRPAFLDTNQFKKYSYKFDKVENKHDRGLLAINFKSKGKIQTKDNIGVKEKGLILIDLQTYAIVSIDLEGEYIIPLGYRPILLMVGLIIREPIYKQKAQYEKYKNNWYPKYFYSVSSTRLTKTHMIKSNEHSHQVTEMILLINEIKTDNVIPIQKDKIFNPWRKLEEQVHNDENLKWSEMNIIKE